jgi:predicted regulator of Ras-like GTPase activity (Roadblock/LC7/MglB family)
VIELSSSTRDLNQQLADLVRRSDGVVEAVLVSPEGLPMAASRGLGRDAVDRFAAVAAGLGALAYGAAGRFGGGEVREVIVEMERAFLLVTRVGNGAALGAVASIEADLGDVGFDVAITAQRLSPMVADCLGATSAEVAV